MVRSRAEVRETLEAGEVELVDQETVLEYRKDLRRVMEYGSVMERRGVMKSFIQQVEREESHVTVHYVLPLPPEKVPDLQPGVLDTVLVGGPRRTDLSLSQKDICRQLRSATKSDARWRGE